MVSCLIVEDEPLGRQVLERYIAQRHDLSLVDSCSNAFTAFEIISQRPVDLLFLDIQLPSLSGLEFVRHLKQPPAVIFITAYAQYAVESYELEAIDYLLKPVTYDRFCRSVAKYLKQAIGISQPPAHTYFKVDGQLVKLLHTDILYVQSIKDYLLIKTAQRSYITHLTMRALIELLPGRIFQRVHRSYVVNVTHLTVIGRKELLVGGAKIPIGERYRPTINDAASS